MKRKTNKKYNNILSRIKKNFSIAEGFFIIIRLYLTNNIFYYILCIIFRFISLIITSGDYLIEDNELSDNSYSIQKLLKKMTLHYILKKFSFSYRIYKIICTLIYILFIIRIFNYFYIIKKIKNKKFTTKWPSPTKYQIIIDHILFLIFPYILEFLSFVYYIYFFQNKYLNTSINKIELIVNIILNTILIIFYNIINFLLIICSNKKYTTTEVEALIQIKNKGLFINNKAIVYKNSNIFLYSFIILQNVVLVQILENCLGIMYKKYYRVIISIILFILMFVLVIKLLYEYNYNNLINYIINMFLFFCLYSILFDAILFISNNNLNNLLYQIIYNSQKILLSYITNLLIHFKLHIYLENKIIEILFQERVKKKEKKFIDAFIYLNEIMLKIQEKNDDDSNFFLLNFLYKHINSCNKIHCNCKLLTIFLKNDDNNNSKTNNNTNKTNYNENAATNLLIVLNFLYEASFIEYDYYNKYEMTILLSEHFCHLRDNPIIAFSLINSLIINQKFSKFQMVELYELCQKYIYFIKAKEKSDKDYEIIEDKKIFDSKILKKEHYQNYFNSIIISTGIKKSINNYIKNLNEILKHKNIFKDNLKFQFDESNEYINKVKINFFDKKTFIENNSNEKHKKKQNIKKKKYSSNLYYILFLLKKEKLCYDNLINYIKKIHLFNDIPIFMIYKFYLFFDIIEGGIIPLEISNILYYVISNDLNIYNNKITKQVYSSLKSKYNNQNNQINSKFFAMYEYKRDLRIKYFNEEFALRLGFKQNKLINENIDILMPKEFCKSHQNLIKRLIIGKQLKYYYLNKSFVFNKDCTTIYSVIPKGILIYDLSKNLIILSENIFYLDNEYNFMLNHNFNILAISKNFEDEYLLNQKIFQLYNLNILSILQMKPENLNHKFEKDFKVINQNNLIKQIKTEEYFIPQIYNSSGEIKNKRTKYCNFNKSKNKMISYIIKSDEKYKDINESKEDMDASEHLIKAEEINNEFFKFFIEPTKLIIHNNINITLNKFNFVENIFKELTKIPDNELFVDNDYINNLIINSKKLVNKLLQNNNFSKDYIKVRIKLNYYDKPFYFISIYDETQKNIRMTKQLKFENTKKVESKNSSIINSILDNITSNKDKKKARNKNINMKYLNKNNDNIISKNLIEQKEIEKNIMKKKIQKYKNEINKERFIFINKLILTIITICIFIVYIIIMYYQGNSINITEKILLSFYYNAHTRSIILNTLSKINGIYHDVSGIFPSSLSASYDKEIITYSNLIRYNYHFFNKYFLEYNQAIHHSFNLIFRERIFLKLRGFWKEIPFNSQYDSEINVLIHSITLVNSSITQEFKSDIDNFLFYYKNKNKNNKINTNFIKLFHYLTINYDYAYKDIFSEINDEIIKSYNNYIQDTNIFYYTLESGGIFFYLFFFVIIFIFFYISNVIIIKNIIFLLIDIDDEHSLQKNNIDQQLIQRKLLKFQTLINDFDMNELNNYSAEINSLNYGKYREQQLIDISQAFNNQLNINNEKKIFSQDSKNNNNELELIQKNNLEISNKFDDNSNSKNNIQKLKSNNSSYNFLIGSESKLFKNNINVNSFDSKYGLIVDKKINNKDINNSMNTNLFTKKINILKNEEIEIKENYQDTILNKSNKTIVSFIKKHLLILIFLIIITISISVYKILNNIIYNKHSNAFFNDFKIITTRYTYIYYYFITLKSLFILSEKDSRWKEWLSIMESMNNNISQSNVEYNDIITHKMSSYKKVSELLDLLQYNQENSSEYIKNKLCPNKVSCHDYLKSSDNIFNSGIDMALKNCFIYINNILLDFKNLKNKTDVNEIISKITSSEFYEFRKLRKAYSNIFYNVQEKIYSSFEEDQYNFRKINKKNIYYLNIISVLLSILIVLFAFFSGIIISNFISPIKNSIYRLQLSFYCIKNYYYIN